MPALTWASRGSTRLVLAGTLVLAAGTLVWRADTQRTSPPPARRNPGYRPPTEWWTGGVRFVRNAAAPELLAVDTERPRGASRLLWFDGRATAPAGDATLVLDADGAVLRVEDALRMRRVSLHSEGRVLASVAADGRGGLWLTDEEGALLHVNGGGKVQVLGPTPFAFPVVASAPGVDSAGANGVWVARSPRRFSYVWDSLGVPLILHADRGGRVHQGIGTPRRPAHALLADLANAGQLATRGDTVFFAPFIRDQVLALRATGETLWVSSRGLPQDTPEPRFELLHGRPVIDYHPVNLGIALGPDGRLYVLSTAGLGTNRARLDAFDPATGHLLRTAALPTALPTLAVDADGRVHLLDADRLEHGIPRREREPFPPFDLPLLAGGRLASAALRGKVALVNFWASWCTPCRSEMPALDALRQRMGDTAFALVALSEDQSIDDARRFLAEDHLTFPAVWGRGEQRERYHYPGLPYTVLLDRQGGVIQRWIGFAGAAQIDEIERLARRELARGSSLEALEHSATHEQHHGGMPEMSRAVSITQTRVR
jgi:thiol-disulfide isomerase/thioredoxin